MRPSAGGLVIAFFKGHRRREAAGSQLRTEAVTMNWLALSAVANVITALAVLAAAFIAVRIGVEVHTVIQEMRAGLGRLRTDISPILENVKGISDEVRGMTESIRGGAERVNETVDEVSKRVHRALAASEERLGEFNALLDVAQDEAERLFISTAATVRGIQRGTEAFRGRSGTDLASDELDEAVMDDATNDQEVEDGHDSSPESAAPEIPPGPRVRPRPGKRRRA
jgi:methyl-accepting chemotaxis protein